MGQILLIVFLNLMGLAVFAQEMSQPIDATPRHPITESEDPETPPPGSMEVSLSARGTLKPDKQRYRLPMLDLDYGAFENAQVHFGVPWIVTHGSNGTHTGVGRLEAGVKYAFYNNEQKQIMMALYPSVEVSPETSAINRHTDKTETIVAVPLIISKKIGQTVVVGNLAFEKVYGGTPDLLAFRVAVGKPISQNIAAIVELDGETGVNFTEKQQLILNVALKGRIAPHTYLFASVGRTLAHSSDEEVEILLSAGFSYLIPPDEFSE